MFDLYDYIIFIFLFKNVFVVSFLTSSSETIVSGSLNVVLFLIHVIPKINILYSIV
jgi:hypothetical protein